MAQGQYYGLMGKRVIVNLEGSTSPAYLNPNYIWQAMSAKSGYSKKYFWLNMNFFAAPGIEVAVWTKGTAGVGYNFTSSPFEGYQDDLYYRENTSETDIYSDFSSYYGHVTAHGFHLYYKQYIGNSKAPVGHYVKFNFDCYFTKYVMDGAPMYERDDDGNYVIDEQTGKPVIYRYNAIPDYLTDEVPVDQQLLFYCPDGKYDIENPYALSTIRNGKSVLPGMKIEYGYDFWPVNFFKLSLGVSLGTTFGGYKGLFNDFFGNGNTFRAYAHTRILGAYWLQFKLGIGFLAF